MYHRSHDTPIHTVGHPRYHMTWTDIDRSNVPLQKGCQTQTVCYRNALDEISFFKISPAGEISCVTYHTVYTGTAVQQQFTR